MRNRLVTPFWKNALQSLPAGIHWRHVHEIEAAERWELRLNALVQTVSRAKAAIARSFHTPRSAH